MIINRALVLVVGFSLVIPAFGQTKLDIRENCGRPTAEYTIQVGDHPGHAFRIEQVECTPEGTIEIGGVAIQKHVATGFAEMDVGQGKNQWAHVFTMANGDSIFAHAEGSASYQGRRYTSSTLKWDFEGGTGKFEKIKGEGSYTCGPGQGGFSCEAKGEYTLP
jgi:hypothetical protein